MILGKSTWTGYYDKILTKARNSWIQSNWVINFQKISAYLEKDDVHIDYACGLSFIGLYSNSKSIGLDIQNRFMQKVYGEKQNSFILINLITKIWKKSV